jgi:DNA ligase-1
MDPILKNKPATFGEIIDSRLEPIIQRAKTRNSRNIYKNRLTLKKVINLYSKTKVNAPEIRERKDWLTRFSRQLESPNSEWNNSLEAAFTGDSRLQATNSRLPTTNGRLQTVNSRLATTNSRLATAEQLADKSVENRNQKIELLAPTRLEVELTRKYKMSVPANGNFPKLYSKSKTGKTQIWQIEVIKQSSGPAAAGGGETAIIRVSYGYLDGKTVVNEKEVTKGKNLGKKNETTPYQQALLDAQSTWQGKVEGGYAENLGNAQVPGLASNNAVAAHKTISPMLALDYHKAGKKIVFPCYVQAKLDGVRSIFFNNALTSRNGKPFTGLEHIIAELAPATKAGLILDGEVYSTKLSFQQFVGLVKKKKFTAEDKEQLKFVNLWVYDCVNDQPFEERLATLKNFFAKNKFTQIHLLPTEECKKREDLKGFHDKFVLEGNEGLMVRNKQGLYQLGSRSNDLQKYKEFEDAEYPVVGFTDGQGIEKGLVIWTCKTKEGKEFHVRPRGTHEERAALFKKAQSYIGKELTVRYQELSEDNIPRFPVGITFRDYE